MTPENFCYWIKGYFELELKVGNGNGILTGNQVQIIKDHLDLVFKKETPNRIEVQKAFSGQPYTLVTDEKAAEDIFCGHVITRHAGSC